MNKFIILRGIQGSGKTTYAKEWVNKDPDNRIRFSNDDLRNMCGQYWVPSREEFISNVKTSFIIKALDMKYDIIIDNMNLNPKELSWLKYIVASHEHTNEYDVETIDFKTPLNVCVERDAKRPNPIGKEVITKTYERYKWFYEDQLIN